MKIWTNLKTAMLNITVEPAIIMYNIALGMTRVNQMNLMIQKVCHPGDSPPLLFLKCEAEAEAQARAATIDTWKMVLLHLVPVLFVIFAGSWSDSHDKRRKPLMYLPLFGQILSDLLCLLNVYFWSWPPELIGLSGSVLPGLAGWRVSFGMATHCYIADISSLNSRTWRNGVCTSLLFMGLIIGAFLYGIMFYQIRHEGVFILCILFNTISLIYLVLFVKENKSSETYSTLSLWKGMFNHRRIVESFKTTFSSRSGKKRCVLLLMLVIAPVISASVEGEFTVLYYFLRYKFNWNEVNYGYYAGYKTIVICFGTLVSMGIFSRLLQIPDAVIGIMASGTLMMASVGFTFASHSWELFVYPVVDFLQGAGMAVVHSIISKTVESNELGQVSSVIGVVDALFPLVNLPLYTQVYKQTFTQLPGAFFLLSFAYGAIGLALFAVVFILMRKQGSVEESKESKHQG